MCCHSAIPRSTCMYEARRQRSSWARIKLSMFLIYKPLGASCLTQSHLKVSKSCPTESPLFQALFCPYSLFTTALVVSVIVWIDWLFAASCSILAVCSSRLRCSFVKDRFVSHPGLPQSASLSYRISSALSIAFSSYFCFFLSLVSKILRIAMDKLYPANIEDSLC